MKFEEMSLNKDKLLEIGESGSKYLSEIEEDDDFIKNRTSFYVNMVRSGVFLSVSIIFLFLSNIITITKDVGEPYLTTQEGLIIKIKEYEVRKR